MQCPFCDFTCCHQLVFDQHMKGHGGTRVYKCLDCEYTTKNRQKITWHIRIHTGEKPYKCHLCKYACADPSRLKVRVLLGDISYCVCVGWTQTRGRRGSSQAEVLFSVLFCNPHRNGRGADKCGYSMFLLCPLLLQIEEKGDL